MLLSNVGEEVVRPTDEDEDLLLKENTAAALTTVLEIVDDGIDNCLGVAVESCDVDDRRLLDLVVGIDDDLDDCLEVAVEDFELVVEELLDKENTDTGTDDLEDDLEDDFEDDFEDEVEVGLREVVRHVDVRLNEMGVGAAPLGAFAEAEQNAIAGLWLFMKAFKRSSALHDASPFCANKAKSATRKTPTITVANKRMWWQEMTSQLKEGIRPYTYEEETPKTGPQRPVSRISTISSISFNRSRKRSADCDRILAEENVALGKNFTEHKIDLGPRLHCVHKARAI
ncbi:hypothetical protein BDZ45DRAFT_735722 [Acephala macrosclerotiorum]|nr:hypothetical protein BDZ45DRAFT_735722 [Acephala macrosclerotiorum]